MLIPNIVSLDSLGGVTGSENSCETDVNPKGAQHSDRDYASVW